MFCYISCNKSFRLALAQSCIGLSLSALTDDLCCI